MGQGQDWGEERALTPERWLQIASRDWRIMSGADKSRPNDWVRWKNIGKGLVVASTQAMKEAGTNKASGNRYSMAMHRICTAHGLHTIGKNEQAALLRIMPKIEEIDAWRSGLDPGEQGRLNNPRFVWKRWRGLQPLTPEEAEKKPRRAAGKNAVTGAREELDTLSKMLREAEREKQRLASENTRLHTELTTVRRAIEQQKAHIEAPAARSPVGDLQAQLQAAEYISRGLRQESADAQDALQGARARIAELERQLAGTSRQTSGSQPVKVPPAASEAPLKAPEEGGASYPEEMDARIRQGIARVANAKTKTKYNKRQKEARTREDRIKLLADLDAAHRRAAVQEKQTEARRKPRLEVDNTPRA